MLAKNRIGIGLILSILFISILSGCLFFPRTTFVVISAEIADEDGFTGLRLMFNASNRVTVTCSRTGGETVYAEMFYSGKSSVFIPFDSYRITPNPGNFLMTVTDQQNSSIFEQTYSYQGGNLTISQIEPFWCNERGWGTIQSLVGLNITVTNQGDLPVYPDNVDVVLGDEQASGLVLPVVVLPGQSAVVCCFVHISEVSEETQQLEVTLQDSTGNMRTRNRIQVLPAENSPVLKYSWQYNGNRHLILPNPQCLLSYYKNLDRFLLEDYAAYIFDRYDDEYLTVVVDSLLAELDSYSADEHQVNTVASFVQAMAYAEDDPTNTTCEYPRYPVEMLGDMRGDCEDKAILLAALLDFLDFNVSLIRLPEHMAVGVHLEEPLATQSYFIDEYYYLESTRTHWTLGMVPSEYKDSSNITVYPLSTRSILFHSWKNATRYTNREGTDFVKVHILVQNVGRGDAPNVEVRGGFFTEHNIIYNQESMVIPSIASGENALVSLQVTVPQGVTTLLKTQLYWNKKQVDEKESVSWFSSKEF